MSKNKGTFLWYDLMTTDIEAAKAFYTEVIGWKTAPFQGGDGDYTMFMVGEQPMGGMMLLPEQAQAMGAPPHWMAYVGTPDVDATVSLAKKLGATVPMPPMEIPEVGRFAVIIDPQGAAISAFQPSSDMPLPAPEPGRVSWNELMSADAEAGLKFYSKLFGWEKTDSMDMGPMGTYQMFGQNGKTYGGMMNRPAEMPMSAWLYYINVTSVKDTIERVTAKGGKLMNGPMDVPGGDVVAQCMDPQGVMFAIHGKAEHN
ncbi:MAG: hypothetical protein AUK47_19490 [Deltaproteobacteria bacterium CG2_30_63_29]|nr:MAG: hypothetical protein AUK47_19490 [Deltaproteobacteria bacterium CG2_30_63_29]PJB37534.1 MAG: glyoxalase [Deltaproteobacteria bacterium CG_4_9_14_3_um_filter_63_12]